MRAYTPQTITDAVIGSKTPTTPDPRMKEVMGSGRAAPARLRAREVNLTPAEWIKGIEFMTKVGQACTPARQEFICFRIPWVLRWSTSCMTRPRWRRRPAPACSAPLSARLPEIESGAATAKKTDGAEIRAVRMYHQRAGRTDHGRQGDGAADAADGRDQHPERYRADRSPCTSSMPTTRNQPDRTGAGRSAIHRRYGLVGQMVMSQKCYGTRLAHIHFLIERTGGDRELVTALNAGDAHRRRRRAPGASADRGDVKEGDPACPEGLPEHPLGFQPRARRARPTGARWSRRSGRR